MMRGTRSWLLLGGMLLTATALAQQAAAPVTKSLRTMAEILAATGPDDWRSVDPAQMLVMEIAQGRIVIELAPRFAPRHVENIKALAQSGYYDGLSIMRVHDNFVVQWGDADGKKSVGNAARTLAPEFTREASADLPFVPLRDRDGHAREAGFSDGFPAARDRKRRRAWLTHCYGIVGVGRDNAADSGGGTELYAVIGHAPRQLDRNITVIGRVLRGIELLAALPRGTAALGFYEKPEQRVPIKSIRVVANLPPAERPALQVLRTDRPAFAALVEARRNRKDDWYLVPAGHIDLCNIPLPVRDAPVVQPSG